MGSGVERNGSVLSFDAALPAIAGQIKLAADKKGSKKASAHQHDHDHVRYFIGNWL
mgnify:CR=1 FL=1